MFEPRDGAADTPEPLGSGHLRKSSSTAGLTHRRCCSSPEPAASRFLAVVGMGESHLGAAHASSAPSSRTGGLTPTDRIVISSGQKLTALFIHLIIGCHCRAPLSMTVLVPGIGEQVWIPTSQSASLHADVYMDPQSDTRPRVCCRPCDTSSDTSHPMIETRSEPQILFARTIGRMNARPVSPADADRPGFARALPHPLAARSKEPRSLSSPGRHGRRGPRIWGRGARVSVVPRESSCEALR